MTEFRVEDAPTEHQDEAHAQTAEVPAAVDGTTDEQPVVELPPAAPPARPSSPEAPAAPIALDGLAYGVDHLDAIVVYYLGDAHVHAAWVRADAGFRAEDVAVRLRDAYRICQSAVRGIEAVSAATPPASTLSDAFVTLETSSRVTFMRRIRSYVVSSLFDAAVPLGMARLMASRIAAAIEPELPYADRTSMRPTVGMSELPPSPEDSSDLEAAKTLAVPVVGAVRPGTKPPPAPRPTLSELDRARRLLHYLEENAPEPHVVRLRVALRAGLTPLALEHPEALGADAIVLIETAVQDILGIDRAELRGLT